MSSPVNHIKQIQTVCDGVVSFHFIGCKLRQLNVTNWHHCPIRKFVVREIKSCSASHAVRTKGYSTVLLIDPTQVESKKSSQIQWPVPSINAEPVDIFLGEE